MTAYELFKNPKKSKNSIEQFIEEFDYLQEDTEVAVHTNIKRSDKQILYEENKIKLDIDYKNIVAEIKKIDELKNHKAKKIEYDRLYRQLELLIQHYIATESMNIRKDQKRISETAIRDKIYSDGKIYNMQKQLNNLIYKSQLMNI